MRTKVIRGAFNPPNDMKATVRVAWYDVRMLRRFFPAVLFISYSVLLVKVMILRQIPVIHLGHVMLNFGGADTGPANLVPFKTISLYLFGHQGWMMIFFELIGNIGLLVPFGFLMPLVCRKMTWWLSLALAILVPLVIEGLQVMLRTGRFDIDDVILNGLGIMIGYWIYAAFRALHSS